MVRSSLFWRSLDIRPSTIRFACLIAFASFALGCDRPEPIVTYSIPTEMPEQFRAGTNRMLAAMLPNKDQTWFFKVTGPEKAIAGIEETFRQFVESVTFSSNGNPDLSDLPDGWRLGANKPMRFASIDVNTAEKQLDISVSSLPKQDDWDGEVVMNVNRWRRQLGLSPSTEKWAEGEAFEVASADGPAVWVDLIGESGSVSSSMMGAPSQMGAMPQDSIHSGLEPATPSRPAADASKTDQQAKSELQYDRPEGWRDGRMSTMRLAAFNVGPEEAEAEITIIPAGGDLRGNVARWLGQIRPSGVSDEVVDAAIENAQSIEVDGRDSKRFLLLGEDAEEGTAIDATIVPLEDNFSLFIKMTGPAKTVTDQSEKTKAFIESLKL